VMVRRREATGAWLDEAYFSNSKAATASRREAAVVKSGNSPRRGPDVRVGASRRNGPYAQGVIEVLAGLEELVDETVLREEPA
jgi:hypothetical protein